MENQDAKKKSWLITVQRSINSLKSYYYETENRIQFPTFALSMYSHLLAKRPSIAKWIFEDSIVVTPELLLQLHDLSAAIIHGFLPDSIGIAQV